MKLEGVAPLIVEPLPANSTTLHTRLGWISKTYIYVLRAQPISLFANFPIWPVQLCVIAYRLSLAAQ